MSRFAFNTHYITAKVDVSPPYIFKGRSQIKSGFLNHLTSKDLNKIQARFTPSPAILHSKESLFLSLSLRAIDVRSRLPDFTMNQHLLQQADREP